MNQGSRHKSVSLRRTFRRACDPNTQHSTRSVNSIGTPEVTQLVANVSAIYTPELVVGFTPVCLQFVVVHVPSRRNCYRYAAVTTRQVSLCLGFMFGHKADGISSQSFHFQGFPATQLFERAGRIADPMYHNSGTSCWVLIRLTQLILTMRDFQGDVSGRSGYDLEQLVSIAKVQVKTGTWKSSVGGPRAD
jgi:hypothetical protein